MIVKRGPVLIGIAVAALTALSAATAVAAQGGPSAPSADADAALAAGPVVTQNGVRVGGSASATAVTPGKAISLSARARSDTARTVVIDIEVYDAANKKVFQKYWTGRKLTAGHTSTWTAAWTTTTGTAKGAYRVAVGVFADGWSPLLAWNDKAISFWVGHSTPTPTPTPTPPGGGAPTHFTTSAVKAALPSSAQCAAWVRALPTPAENKRVNIKPNATAGAPLSGATSLLTRVDGAFTGTTEQVLRWTACKWGIDEDVVKAQAAVESWWRMNAKGDWTTDSTRCTPGHPIGADGTPGQCPESWGLLQVRYPYHQIAFMGALNSSALNADYAYALWRECYTGELTWLNDVEHGSTYAAGDADGCLGVWFSGRWHTAPADQYIAKVKGYLSQKIWTTPDFQEP
jgi:autotransporter family porin